jgi:hypothetical protein
MNSLRLLVAASLVFAAVGGVAHAGEASKMPLSPEDTVSKYLGAMQANNFDEAFNYVSEGLRGGKAEEEWVKEQQYIIQMGEVKIFGFEVFKAVMVDKVAKVPNILKSQDKYLNQLGLDEYELYDLIPEDGGWKVDQQTLVEGPERKEYFPEH